MGRSWGRLGTSWVAPGPSWAAPGGHFGLPGVTFSRFLGGFFGGLARGLEKARFSMFLWCFLSAVLLLFLSLSCLPRGAPGRNANIENSLKHGGFYDEFAWVAFLRQVQREQISEHRHTQNYKKNTCKNSPRDVSKSHQKKVHCGSQNGAKIPSKSLPEACRRPLAPQDAPKTQPRAANATKKTPRASQERSKSAGKRFSGRRLSRTEAPPGSSRTAGEG